MHVPQLIISKILEYSTFSSPIEVLENIINMSHLAPIAPDIIPTAPFQDVDPFIVTSLPGVKFKISIFIKILFVNSKS